MGGQNYKIASLNKTANYDRWSEDIQEILTLDHCWLVTIGKEIVPKVPQALSEEKPASITSDGTLVKAIKNTDLAKDLYKAKIEKYKKKLFGCDEKYS